jgi:virginiamycin B lyase
MSRRSVALLSATAFAAGLSTVALQAAERPAARLPDGKGKELVEAYCIACHTTDYPVNVGGYSREHWRELVTSMLPLKGKQLDEISDYLAASFPPTEARKPKLVPGDIKITFQPWKVPTLGQMARDPVQGPDGHIWWVAQFAAGNLLGRLDPKTGEMKEFPLPEGTLPHSVTPDAQGVLWVSGNGNGTIVRVDPKTAAMKVYKMPDPAAKDPHTMVFDRNGIMWFTVQFGNMLGRFDTTTGAIKLVKSPRADSRPYDIALDSQGNAWVACRNANCVLRLDTKTMAIKEYTLPHKETWIRRLAIASDDSIWYGDTGRGYLAHLDPKTGAVKEWASPSGPKSEPYGVEIIDDVVWYNESGKRPDALVRFDPKTQKFQSWAIPSQQGFYGAMNRNMRKTKEGDLLIHQGSSNNIILVKIPKPQQQAAR